MHLLEAICSTPWACGASSKEPEQSNSKWSFPWALISESNAVFINWN